jgi:hypothetical protein
MESREATQFLHTVKQIRVYSYLSSSVIIIIYYFYFHGNTKNINTPKEGRMCGVVQGEEIRPDAM